MTAKLLFRTQVPGKRLYFETIFETPIPLSVISICLPVPPLIQSAAAARRFAYSEAWYVVDFISMVIRADGKKRHSAGTPY